LTSWPPFHRMQCAHSPAHRTGPSSLIASLPCCPDEDPRTKNEERMANEARKGIVDVSMGKVRAAQKWQKLTLPHIVSHHHTPPPTSRKPLCQKQKPPQAPTFPLPSYHLQPARTINRSLRQSSSFAISNRQLVRPQCDSVLPQTLSLGTLSAERPDIRFRLNKAICPRL
jgi:hypothetical protein